MSRERTEAGRMLREARRSLDLTQQQVGDAVGVTKQCVCNWERGTAEPISRYLHPLCQALEIEASAGGGIVTARMNGKKELLAIKLGAEAITPDDPELLEDLIIAAGNEASRKVDAELQELTQGMAGGMNIPGLG